MTLMEARISRASRILSQYVDLGSKMKKSSEMMKQAKAMLAAQDAIKAQLAVSQRKVEDLQARNRTLLSKHTNEKHALSAALSFSKKQTEDEASRRSVLEARLSALERQIKILSGDKESLTARVFAEESKVTEWREKYEAISRSLQEKDAELLRLKEEAPACSSSQTAEIERLKKRVNSLKHAVMRSQDPLPHIRGWVQSEAYRNAAQFSQGRSAIETANYLRAKFLEQFPAADLDKLRIYDDERLTNDGKSLMLPVQTPPPVFLDSENLNEVAIEERNRQAMSKNYRFKDPNPVSGEVVLPDKYYSSFRKEHQTCARKRARMDEQKDDYLSSSEEVDDSDSGSENSSPV